MTVGKSVPLIVGTTLPLLRLDRIPIGGDTGEAAHMRPPIGGCSRFSPYAFKLVVSLGRITLATVIKENILWISGGAGTLSVSFNIFHMFDSKPECWQLGLLTWE